MIKDTALTILHFYTRWPADRLLWAAGIFAAAFLSLEVILGTLIRIRRGDAPGRKRVFPPWLLKIFRTGLRYLFIYLFVRTLRNAPEPGFPWNLAYHFPLLLLFFTGILSTLFKGISILEKKKFSDFPENSLIQQLIVISRKGLKTILSLIFLSLFFWRILELFPGEVRHSAVVTGLIIANEILIITVLLLVVQRVFNAAESLSSHRKIRPNMQILLDSLSIPVRLLILSLATVWMQTLVPESPVARHVLSQITRFLLLTALIIFIYQALEFLGARISRYSDEDTNTLDKTLVEMFRMFLRIVIITAGIFGAIRIFTGKPLTTLLAGLGIGGLAVALAAQDTLKNFFGSIMIMSDKPFKIGERIVSEGHDGVIETIGFRSTRLRTLAGNQVVIPNEKLAGSAVENIGRRPNIRRLTNITITYDTPPEKVERALEIIRNILDNHEGMTEDFPPRVNFSEFNADSLNIQMLYWYSPPDYWKYMEFTEKVNLAIMREFNREGIQFAFPSVTTYLEQPEGKAFRFEMGPGQPEKDPGIPD